MRLTACITLILVAACSSLDEFQDARNWSAEKLYTKAKGAMDDGLYESAIKYYETLEAQYPFGAYAEQAILDSAYAYLLYEEPDTAIATADRFIKLHPRHEHVDYAYYLRGLASQSKKKPSLDFFNKQDQSLRDPANDQKSYDYFAELVKNYPNSRYAADARRRMGLLRNSLAHHELYVAQFYLRRNAPVAAANRAKYILDNFPRTPSRNGALLVLVQAYAALGMTELEADARRVLELNDPQALQQLQDKQKKTQVESISGS